MSEPQKFNEMEPLERLGDWKHPIAHLSPEREYVNLSTWQPFLTVADARRMRDWLAEALIDQSAQKEQS